MFSDLSQHLEPPPNSIFLGGSSSPGEKQEQLDAFGSE